MSIDIKNLKLDMAKQHREAAAYHDRMARAAERDQDPHDAAEHRRKGQDLRRQARQYEVD